MERHFDEDLKNLKAELLKMAALAEESILNSTEALKNKDVKLAENVIEKDKEIDKKELEIEESAIELLALHQPVASDLRFITTGMKINAELERIADLSVNICQRVMEMGDEPHVKPLIDIPKLSELARKMVKEAIDAFVNNDEELAKKVVLSDSEADKLRNMIHKELINDYMVKDGSVAPRAVPLLLISRHLERICDHATYIAEDVIYMVQAKVIRHQRDKLKEDKSQDK
jgi:phosphate transport system protein